MAVECFLKIDGPELKGESKGSDHEEEIDVLGWSWGMSQTGTMHLATGGGAGKADVHDMSITKYVDAASPNLMKYCASGKQFEKAILTCRKVAGDGEKIPYITIEMSKVIITALSESGISSDTDLFNEQLSLNFAEVTFKYGKQNDDGTAGDEIEAGWNIRMNAAA